VLERAERTEIPFPRVLGYRLEIADERLHDFSETSDLVLSARDLPTTTPVSGLLGAPGEHRLETLEVTREGEVVFRLARAVLDKHLRSRDGSTRPGYFPQLVPIVCEWVQEHVTYKDRIYAGLLLLGRHSQEAVDKIGGGFATVAGNRARTLLPVLTRYDATGSTAGVSFDTSKKAEQTEADKCHISHVVRDSGWEDTVAQVLETLPQGNHSRATAVTALGVLALIAVGWSRSWWCGWGRGVVA
jgi:type III restriction enzyme